MNALAAPLFLVLAAAAGGALAVQAVVNAQLRTWLVFPLLATLTSFAVGTLALVVLVVVRSEHRVPLASLAPAPWWVWSGGLLGVIYLYISIIATPRIGPALFFGFLVAGQLLAALVLEHFALLGVERHPVNAGRVLGALLLVVALVLLRRF